MTWALQSSGARRRAEAAFTLLEVMIALAVLGIALMALLSLHHQDLLSVIRAREMTQAAMLAEQVMSTAEVERFPTVGITSGNFESLFPGRYPNFRWRRVVENSGLFPDLRKVTVTVYYGPRFGRSFSLVELMHNPEPPLPPTLPGQRNGALGQAPPVGMTQVGPGQQ
jgi:general secretion pathway protein I